MKPPTQISSEDPSLLGERPLDHPEGPLVIHQVDDIFPVDIKCVWVKNRNPKWNPGKWKQGQKPPVPWWLYLDPYLNVEQIEEPAECLSPQSGWFGLGAFNTPPAPRVLPGTTIGNPDFVLRAFAWCPLHLYTTMTCLEAPANCRELCSRHLLDV